MTTVKVSLPEDLKEYVSEAVSRDNFSSASAYIRALINADRLRREGNRPAPPGDGFDFEWQELRDRIHARSDAGWVRE